MRCNHGVIQIICVERLLVFQVMNTVSEGFLSDNAMLFGNRAFI